MEEILLKENLLPVVAIAAGTLVLLYAVNQSAAGLTTGAELAGAGVGLAAVAWVVLPIVLAPVGL